MPLYVEKFEEKFFYLNLKKTFITQAHFDVLRMLVSAQSA